MRKLLIPLLLILSFFSAQSFAGSCPDGSEPVKSISDDGTFFVYNCGGQASSSSVANSDSKIKAVKYESFVDTNTSSSCKDLDKELYRNSYNKCSIIAVLDTKLKFPNSWHKNVWQISELLINRVNKDGNLEIIGKAENIQVETGEKTDRKGLMQIASIVVNTEELGSNSVQVIKNPIVEIPTSSLRFFLMDVNQDGLTELVIAGMLEDGRHQDSSWSEVNFIYDFETESYSEFGKPLYSHDFVAGDLDDDSYDEFIDISWNGGHGDNIGVCNGKTLECVYQNHPQSLHTSKTSLSVYPNKQGGILFHNCSKDYLDWCWSEVAYINGRIELKLLDKYVSSKKPDKEVLRTSWQGWTQKSKGWQVPGYKTSERFLLKSESYRSHQFDMDNDGDFDTVTWKENVLCKKPALQETYDQILNCREQVAQLIFFRNNDGKFTVSDTHEMIVEDGAGTFALYNYDINKDGHMDFYLFRDQYNTTKQHCHKQFNNIFFGNSDGTFRRPSIKEQNEIFGNYGCEIQSYFFDFEGESYRTFFTHKFGKNFNGHTSREVYVGVEKIATKAEKAKRIAEEAAEEAAKSVAVTAKAAEDELIEKELAEFEAELEEKLAAEVADAIAKRKAKVAAVRAKRIAEEELIEKELAELKAKLAEENKSSPIFDGRYSFDLFRYHDDEDWQELGNGFVEIMNGELIIDKDNSDLKTGSKDLYDTFSGQINKKGKVSASTELDILGGGVDRSEIYHLNGHIDGKIWGDSPREDFFRVYMLLVKK